jgi:hypothetical protein
MALSYREHNPGLQEIYEFLSTYGMTPDNNDCYEHIFLYTVQDAIQRNSHSPILFAILSEFFPKVLIDLIFEYIPIKNFVYKDNKQEMAGLIPQSASKFCVTNDSPYITFTLPLRLTQGNLIAEHINNIRVDSASVTLLEDKEQHPKDQKLTASICLTVKKEVVINSDFFSDMGDRIETLPHTVLDRFRKEAKTINLSTAECLEKLLQAKKTIKDNKLNEELPSAIDELVQHIEQQGLEKKEYNLLCNSLIENVRVMSEYLIESASAKTVSWFSRFFAPPNPIEIEKDIHEALHGIGMILNKQFQPSKMQTIFMPQLRVWPEPMPEIVPNDRTNIPRSP